MLYSRSSYGSTCCVILCIYSIYLLTARVCVVALWWRMQVSTPLPYAESSTIVAFTVQSCSGHEIIRWCEERGILVAGNFGKAVRLSAHVYNTKEEVDKLVEAVKLLQEQHSMVGAPLARL